MVDSASVDKKGRVSFPEEQRRRWGLAEGTELTVRETPEGLLLRPADPPLSRVYVEPTSHCNLDCRTCVRDSWDEPRGTLAMETYERLIEGLYEVPTLRKVSFWGFGEPLLHPDIVDMVAYAKELGVQTELITNALLLDKDLSRRLVAAGLDTLVVSIDGTTDETYADVRSGADLNLVRRNISWLRYWRSESGQHKPEIGIEFVAMQSNIHELPKLRYLAPQIGASFIVVTNLLPYSKEMSNEILYSLSVGKLHSRIRNKWAPEVTLPTMDARNAVMVPLLGLMERTEGPISRQGRLNGTGGYCRFVGEGTVAVSWDGEVSPCVALMHSHTCFVLGREKRVKRYSVGNVARESIATLWQGEEFRALRDRVQKFDFSPCSACGGCHYSETNEEDCYGNPFPVCGDCLWAQGVIQCP